MSGQRSTEEADDPLISEFMALRQAVADQLRAMARLETTLGQVRGEVARKIGPEQFKETFAAIRHDLATLAERVDRQEAAVRALPHAGAIGAAVREATDGLVQDAVLTRTIVQANAQAARSAAEEARNAARDAAGDVGRLDTIMRDDRRTVQLALAAILVLVVIGGGVGWSLRGWWAPTPSGVFARYLAAGNNPYWLLCEGGKAVQRFVADNGTPACDLKFWLSRSGP